MTSMVWGGCARENSESCVSNRIRSRSSDTHTCETLALACGSKPQRYIASRKRRVSKRRRCDAGVRVLFLSGREGGFFESPSKRTELTHNTITLEEAVARLHCRPPHSLFARATTCAGCECLAIGGGRRRKGPDPQRIARQRGPA